MKKLDAQQIWDLVETIRINRERELRTELASMLGVPWYEAPCISEAQR